MDRITREEFFKALKELKPTTYHTPDYGNIPQHVREWLQTLDKEDLQDVIDGARAFRNGRIIFRACKWLVIGSAAFLAATGQVGKAITDIGALFG